MISNKPYLIRALYQWIVDNGWTPHLQVDANYPASRLPEGYADENGVIVFNVAPEAVRQLDLANEQISFKARFQGIEQQLAFNPAAVLAIFAKENGMGMPFQPEAYPDENPEPPRPPKGRPNLRVVK